MGLSTLLESLRPALGRRARKRSAPCRLTVEFLEARDVPSYAVTDLGVTAGFDNSYASGINQAGHVAGYETSTAGGLHAFLWRNGAMTDLGTLGGAISYAFAVNDSDQVVGTSQTGALDANGNPIFHAFLWQNGAMTDLGALAGGV